MKMLEKTLVFSPGTGAAAGAVSVAAQTYTDPGQLAGDPSVPTNVNCVTFALPGGQRGVAGLGGYTGTNP